MLRETYYEIIKIFTQKKNYVVIFGHLLMLLLCYVAFRTNNFHFIGGDVREMFGDITQFVDGMFFARLAALPTFMMIMPIFVSTIAGDIIAGEIQDGSLKLYLARPRSRSRLVASKMLAVFVVTLIYCIYFSVLCLVVGILLVGKPLGSQLIYMRGMGLGNSIVLMDLAGATWRYVLMTLYYSFSLMSLAAIVLFLSTLFNRMTAATVSGITLYFVCYIIERLPFAEKIAPYMLSRVMNYPDLYILEIPLGRFAGNMAALGLYVALFLMLSMISFSMKDIK
jgi:ABC-2 type transport system permease protein